LKLFVDDERSCPNGWGLARTYDEAVYFISTGKVEAISLDHDLGEEKTGYDLACLLENLVMRHVVVAPEQMLCHSSNPVGRQRIEACFMAIRRFIA
jgi:NAD+-processing family protein with receiver domain